MPREIRYSRRTILGAVLAAGLPFGRFGVWFDGHPTPRPGVTAAKILPTSELKVSAEIGTLFDQVREIPGVADGIRCQCSCADLEDYYSLLSCFEGPGAMVIHCEICQAQARLTVRLHKAGRTLDQIRKAIDARFG